MAGNWAKSCFRRIAVGVFLVVGCQPIAANAAEKAWPTNGWRTSTPEAQGMHSGVLADMVERIRWNEYRIHSVSVVRNGHLVLDAYFHPWQKGWRHFIHSSTKSVMSALIGIAVDKGHIAGVEKPVLDFFPDRTVANVDARKRAMTLEHLLTMTSGLKCRDSYKYRWTGLGKMMRSADWTQFVLDLPMEAAPGKKFEYCSGASFLLSAILAKATKRDTFEFAKTHLFAPLGITNVSWSRSPRGISNGWGGMWLTPHDMAKFGWLFVKKGKWDGRQVISSAWVERSTRRHVDATLFDHYGFQWWGDARGYYMAVGYKGQRIFVVPQKNMVAVFTGNLGPASTFAPKTLLDKFILPAATSDVALPANSKQQERLASLIEVSVRAPKPGEFRKRAHVWKSSADGTARDGVFVRRNSPAFRFNYPPKSRRDEPQSATDVLRMRTPSGVVFSANVIVIPKGVALADVGPVSYAALLRRLGSDVKVVSNNQVALSDGTAAYRTEFRWRTKGIVLKTAVLSAFKDGKWVLVATHHPIDVHVADLIMKSLVFQRTK